MKFTNLQITLTFKTYAWLNPTIGFLCGVGSATIWPCTIHKVQSIITRYMYHVPISIQIVLNLMYILIDYIWQATEAFARCNEDAYIWTSHLFLLENWNIIKTHTLQGKEQASFWNRSTSLNENVGCPYWHEYLTSMGIQR